MEKSVTEERNGGGLSLALIPWQGSFGELTVTEELQQAGENDTGQYHHPSRLTREDEERAIALLRKPSLRYDYGNFVQRLGIVGEEKNIRIMLLALTSRLIPRGKPPALPGDSRSLTVPGLCTT